MAEQGKLIVNTGKQGKLFAKVRIGDKEQPLQGFNISLELNGQECLVHRIKGRIVKVELPDGKELSPQVPNSQNQMRVQAQQGFRSHPGGSRSRQDPVSRSEPSREVSGLAARPSKPAGGDKRINSQMLGFMPRDSREMLQMNPNPVNCNFSLLLNKTPQFSGKFELPKKPFPFSGIDFSALVVRRTQMLQLSGLQYETIELNPDWRFVVGLGEETVYETGITLESTYGFPYIPASSIKGVVRSFTVANYFESEEKANKDPGFCTLFGKTSSREEMALSGGAIFFDAIPVKPPKMILDIMNSHYNPYYSSEGKTPPGDYFHPLLNDFLTVTKTPFLFAVGVKKEEEIKTGVFGGQSMLTKAKELLTDALSQHGIGAKTAVGYGVFARE